MQRIMWCGGFAIAALAAPTVGQAQPQQPTAPQATVREVGTIEGDDVSDFVLLPGGRTLLYVTPPSEDSTFVYDFSTKRRTVLGTNMPPGSVSPQGDRLAFTRRSEDRAEQFVWTMPIDRRTGSATGQAQRVSLRPFSGFRPMFSPDGKMLAFNSRRPDGTLDLTLVPSTGGAERVLANYSGRRPGFGWSTDGQSLFVQDSEHSIERVSVVDGRREALVPKTAIKFGDGIGFSPDLRVAFFHQWPDRFFYRTTAGVEGEVSVALPPLEFGGGYTLTLDSSMRYTMGIRVRSQGVRVLDLVSGQSRDLLPGNVSNSSPAWSRDGRRIALLTGNLSHLDITVLNANGSSPRVYRVPQHLDGQGQSPWGDNQPWSPDGRFLAFGASTGKVGWSPGDKGQLGLLDLNSGQTRVLTTSALGIPIFVWRSDGQAIRNLKRAIGPDGTPSQWSIVEVPLNGPERTLRDISAEFPRVINVVFISDRAVVVKTNPSSERFLVPLDSGAARRLPDPGPEPGTRIGNGTLVAGNRLLVGQIDAQGEARVIKIVSTVGEPTRTLPIPFNGHHGVLHPDGRQIINVGRETGDSIWKLFLVPLDGSQTRLIGEIPRGTGGLLAPSPDGKLLAYTSDGPITSRILEIDFAPAFQAIMKR
jgi:Tol biopolymer transport system component